MRSTNLQNPEQSGGSSLKNLQLDAVSHALFILGAPWHRSQIWVIPDVWKFGLIVSAFPCTCPKAQVFYNVYFFNW